MAQRDKSIVYEMSGWLITFAIKRSRRNFQPMMWSESRGQRFNLREWMRGS
jgi:hypothetical protein